MRGAPRSEGGAAGACAGTGSALRGGTTPTGTEFCGTLRLAAVFALGRRFTGLVAIQEEHRLQTGGLYRRIRQRRCCYMADFVLVFRCWLGLLLVAGTLAVLLARTNAEEALLESEFGEEYSSYRRRTWRLIPWVY
jgi:protein-S-isoprenylcysteine O-methyltransferase Ste14